MTHKMNFNLLRVCHDITMDMNKDKVVILVLLDLSAAFDTIETSQLLNTLKDCFCVRGLALQWIKPYMFSRFLECKLEMNDLIGVNSSMVYLRDP